MSNEELVSRIQKGESLEQELWEQVEKFVAMKAGRIARQNSDYAAADYDDYYQSGYLAMLEAVQTYQPEKESSFIGWFNFYLQRAFASVGGYRSEKDKASPLKYAASLDAPLPDNEDLTLLEAVPSPRDDYEAVEDKVFNEQLHNALEEALTKLDEKLAGVLRGKYFEGKSQGEIGEAIGCSYQYAASLEHIALRRMRAPHIKRNLEPFVSFYGHVSVKRFNTTHTSVVEEIVLLRERFASDISAFERELRAK